MSWRPHGHVRVNSRSPRAAGVCDRCGRIFNHNTLRFQWDWAGVRLQNLRILVCDSGCYDEPQEQLRAKILTADPIPIWNARPEPFTFTGYSYQESNIMCQPTFGPLDFNSGFGPDFASPFSYPGIPGTFPNRSGLVMAMPGGQTFMLMPDNPNGSSP